MAFSSSGNIPTAVPDSFWFILTLHRKSLQFFLLLPLGLDRLYLCHYVAEGPTSVPQHPGTPNVHKGESLPPGKNSWEMRFCYIMILFYFVVNPWLFGSAQTLRVLPHSRCLPDPACLPLFGRAIGHRRSQAKCNMSWGAVPQRRPMGQDLPPGFLKNSTGVVRHTRWYNMAHKLPTQLSQHAQVPMSTAWKHAWIVPCTAIGQKFQTK